MSPLGPLDVSFLLFAYNQEKTVAAAVEAALNQDCAPLDIILSDDGSSDDTFSIMKRLANAYAGPHRVRARRSPRNRGVINHVNDVVGEASGSLLVFAAGDDISLPDRTGAVIKAWREGGQGTAAIYSDYFPVDDRGEAVNLGEGYFFSGEHSLEGMARGFIEAFGGTAAYTRDLFASFPPMMPDVIHEDRVLPFRAVLLGGKIIVIEEKLVRYTVTGGVSRQQVPTGMRDFTRRFFPNQHRRLLGDARQRERDIAALDPGLPEIAQLCKGMTATHEAIIRLSESKGLASEAALLRSLRSGAYVKPTLKHYLKLRLPIPYRGQR